MTALRRLSRDQARPYNFALSPVLVNLAGREITLLGPFEKDPTRWEGMTYVNIHDGSTHTLKPLTLPVLAQTFDMVFAQYVRHPESKSLAPDGAPCNGDTCGLLGRYPVTASGFHLIGKETERGWEQSEDISTLFPSLMRYQDGGVAGEQLRQRLLQIPLRDGFESPQHHPSAERKAGAPAIAARTSKAVGSVPGAAGQGFRIPSK